MPHKVLITGANGFIGSHVTHLMESLDYRVIPIWTKNTLSKNLK